MHSRIMVPLPHIHTEIITYMILTTCISSTYTNKSFFLRKGSSKKCLLLSRKRYFFSSVKEQISKSTKTWHIEKIFANREKKFWVMSWHAFKKNCFLSGSLCKFADWNPRPVLWRNLAFRIIHCITIKEQLQPCFFLDLSQVFY